MQMNIANGQVDETRAHFFSNMALPLDVQSLTETDFNTSGLVAGLDYLMHMDLRSLWQRQVIEAPEIISRIHWIHGEKDRICPPAAVPTELNERTEWLEEIGHAPMLEDVQRVTMLIRRLCNHVSDEN
jgi:pimeloyl-ACP methyl ester carboxylesterase